MMHAKTIKKTIYLSFFSAGMLTQASTLFADSVGDQNALNQQEEQQRQEDKIQEDKIQEQHLEQKRIDDEINRKKLERDRWNRNHGY